MEFDHLCLAFEILIEIIVENIFLFKNILK